MADFGIVTTSTQYTMQPAELGRWLEAHGFESLWFGEHSHIPTSRKSPYPGGELPEFAKELLFFDDTGFRQLPSGQAIAAFGWASWTAWMLGRADVARGRLAKMRLAVRPANPHDLAWSDSREANLHIFMRENVRAEAAAARALELCEKYLFPSDAAISRCALGHARAELGRPTDGIALIRQGIDTWGPNRAAH